METPRKVQRTPEPSTAHHHGWLPSISPANLRGRYMSVYWLAWGISRGGAPLIGGWLNDHVSPQSIWVGGLLIGLTSAVGLLLLSHRKPEQSLVELPAN